METLVTIDFDGVVSPINKDFDFSADENFVIVRLGGFHCAIRKSTLNFLKRLSEASEVTVIWGSSWNEETESFFKDSEGLIPQFEWINVQGGKPEAILEHALENEFTRVVLIDDDSKVVSGLRRVFKKNSEIDFLAVKPSLHTGLLESHITKIQDFLSN